MVPLSKSQVGQSIHTLDSLEPFFWSAAQIHPPISTCSKSVHCEPSKSLNKTVDLLSKNPNSLILTHTHTQGEIFTPVQQFQYVALNKQRSVILSSTDGLDGQSHNKSWANNGPRRPSWARPLLHQALQQPKRGKQVKFNDHVTRMDVETFFFHSVNQELSPSRN